MMPWFSVRSSASFTTSSMSTSFFELLVHQDPAGVGHLHACAASCPCGSICCSHSVKLKSVPFHPLGRLHHLQRRVALLGVTSISTSRSSSFPSRSMSRSFSRDRFRLSSSAVGSRLGLPPGRTTNIGRSSPPAARLEPAAARARRQQQIEQLLLRPRLRLRVDLVLALGAHQVDRRVHQVAHHALDVAAHVAHLGELRRLHLDERGAGQPRQAPGDLGLPDAGRTDQDDVVGVISSRICSGACARRQRLRTAMAIAFFAASCPTM